MEQKLDLRIQKTYHALHTAFTQLLEEKTFEEITINELCDRSMIRRTTFYKHFTDKYEYFRFYLHGLRQSFQPPMSSEAINADPLSYSVQMLHEMFKFTREHKKLVERMQNSNMTPFLYQSLQEQFVEEMRYVFTSTTKQPITAEQELLISFYAGGLINVVYWWFNNPDTLNEKDVIDYIVKYVVPPTIPLCK